MVNNNDFLNIVLRNEEVLLSKNASSFLGSKLFTTTRVVELTARKLLEARGILSERSKLISLLRPKEVIDLLINQENADILGRYMLQGTNYSKEEFIEIENEIIRSKEDQVMKSTYDRLIDEGIEKGMEKVALRMLEQNMELKFIAKITNLSIQQLKK